MIKDKKMCEKTIILILISLVLTLSFYSLNAYAQNENLEEIVKKSDSLIMNFNMEYGFELKETQSNYETQYVNAFLSLYPFNDRFQIVKTFSTYPDSEIEDSKLFFEWNKPSLGQYHYGLNSEIQTKIYYTEFHKKPSFPITYLNDEIIFYIKPSEHIDSDNQLIKEKASEIVKGETDLFSAVYQVGIWVKDNVDYDLNTLTAEVSQKSSWVLENKYGVCDEITNLFIGLLRSVGVPARFISGMSYTNTGEYANTWGSHGWAEVYFPDIGWVPFDVTYGQYGYIDASHIKLREAEDVGYSSVEYNWLSNGISFRSLGNKQNVTLSDYSGVFEEPISIEARAVKSEVGFGSYNLIELSIKNEGPFYVPLKLYVSKTEGLELIDNQISELLLFPYDNTTLFFRFKVTEDLKNQFIYTFPIQFNTLHGKIANVNFTSQFYSPSYSLNEFDVYENIRTLTSNYISKIEIDCYQGKEIFYIEDNPYFLCEVTNLGNVPFKDLIICLDECFNFSLSISETKIFKMNLLVPSIGNLTKMIYVTGETYSSQEKEILVFDKPSLLIQNLKYPSQIKYGIEFPISFSILKNSFSNPKDVKVKLSNSMGEKIWNFDEIDNENNLIVNVDSSNIRKSNLFIISIEYYDLNGNQFFIDESFIIQLVDLTPKQKLILFFQEIIFVIDNNQLISTILISIIVFVIIYLIINTNKIKLKKEKEKLRKESLKELIKDSELQEKEDEKFFKNKN